MGFPSHLPATNNEVGGSNFFRHSISQPAPQTTQVRKTHWTVIDSVIVRELPPKFPLTVTG